MPVSLAFPLPHGQPGRYQLLLEVLFRDQAGREFSVDLHFPYTFVEAGGRPEMPVLDIAGDRLRWASPPPATARLALDLATGPHWRLASPVAPTAASFELRAIPGQVPLPDARQRKLASLSWVGKDGYHYSRIIPWDLRTDAAGNWIRADGRPATAILDRVAGPVLPAWLAALSLLAGLYLARRPRRRAADAYRFIALALVLTLTAWLAAYLHPALWFTPSWPTGGDLASHVLYAATFRDWLFEGRITGWMPDVFAGFPAFRFYFPLPFALIALLSLVWPIQVAIKLVATVPALLLPLAVFWMAGRFQWPAAARAFAALFAVGFLVHGGSSIWGGNLLSLLSGEFSYSWGLLFTVLFWGSLARSLRLGGRSWIAPALLEVLVGLSHGYPLLVAGFGALLAPLFVTHRGRALFCVLKIHLAAFLVLGFWLLPLLENLPETIPNDTATWIKNLDAFVPAALRPLLLGLPLLAYGVARRDAGTAGLRFLVLVALLALLGYCAAWRVGLADIRFFPLVQLTLAIALGGATGLFLQRWGDRAALWAAAIAAPLLVNVWLDGMTRVEQWSRWNLEGFENKAMWPHYRALADHLAGELGEARVIFEHDPANADIGSTRALEALPLFGSRPVLEGLYMESAISGPFIYQLQAELSARPSSPLSRFPAVKGTRADIADRLADFYVDTVVVRSRESVAALDNHPRFTRSGQFGPLVVYRSEQPTQLVSPAGEIESLPEAGWLEAAYERYILPVPGRATAVFGSGELPAAAAVHPAGDPPARVVVLEAGRHRLHFTTTHPGRPHLVRMSFHPAWRSAGGERLYRAEPAFMMIVPEREDVVLHFVDTRAQHLGRWFTAAGILLLLLNPLPVAGLAGAAGRGTTLVLAGLLLGGVLLAAYLHPNRSYNQAHALFASGGYAASAERFEAAVERRRAGAHRAEALFWAARSYQLAGEPEQADRLYARLVRTYPASYWAPESLYRRVALLRQAGRPAASAQPAQALLDHFPRSVWADRLRQALP
jgi:tetratricopeptide (TPR) repeat protein